MSSEWRGRTSSVGVLIYKQKVYGHCRCGCVTIYLSVCVCVCVCVCVFKGVYIYSLVCCIYWYSGCQDTCRQHVSHYPIARREHVVYSNHTGQYFLCDFCVYLLLFVVAGL